MTHEPTALQLVRSELGALGAGTDSRAYAAIRWLLAEHAYTRLQEASNSLGIALDNMRREAVYWKEEIQNMDQLKLDLDRKPGKD